MDRLRRPRSRGQILLVTAFVLAIALGVLALLLTASIQAESWANDEENRIDESEVLTHENRTENHTRGAISNVNAEGHADYGSLVGDLQARIGAWDEVSSTQTAADGAATSVTLGAVTNGTRIVHDDGSSFEDRSGNDAWQPAENVTHVRAFRVDVTEESLTDPGNESCEDAGTCFQVTVENETATWTAFAGADGSDVVVTVENASGEREECRGSGESVEIDFVEGTVDGADCDSLAVVEDLEPPYAVEYANADAASGTYELTVDRWLPASPAVEGTPAYEPVVDAATVEVTYRTPELTYEAERRVTPGETNG